MEPGWKRNLNYEAADGSFRFHHARDERPNPRIFQLHYEKGCEIYMFIGGAGSYQIEGNRYGLEPYSVLIMNSNELHTVSISEHSPYERIVLSLNPGFLPPFMLGRQVDFFRKIKYRKLGQDNQIAADTVRSSGLLDLFMKLRELLKEPSPENEIVAKCVIVQMLSVINGIPGTEPAGPSGKVNDKISAVLEYINSHLDEPLHLDALSEQFYVTKYHLCHIFKEATGYTINQYITYKRIRRADELMLEGLTPIQACFASGFNGYSNFYKAYRKLTGKPPKSGKLK